MMLMMAEQSEPLYFSTCLCGQLGKLLLKERHAPLEHLGLLETVAKRQVKEPLQVVHAGLCHIKWDLQ